MSKVPYTINVDEYICTELEIIRKMTKTLDFSGLAAVVERIQHHGSSMENALYRYDGIKHSLVHHLDDKELSDKEFREKARKILAKLKD